MLHRSLMFSLLIATATSAADEAATVAAAEQTAALAAAAQPKPDAGAGKTLSGISILGNQEAPKALVIVPWKSSEIG